MLNTKRQLLGKIAIASLLLWGAVSASSAQTPDKVKLRVDWVFGSEHAPIFLAMERGYFKSENIDLDLLPGEGSSVTVKLVGNRDAEFGYATADQILIGAQKGLDLVATAVVLQQNPTAMIFKKSSNIKDLKTDLYGKTVGVQLKSNTGRQWEALKKILQLDSSKLREVPADGAIVPMIASNRVDVACGFYFNDALKLRATGEDVDWILLEDFGIKMYSTSLVTNPALVKEKPDLVRRFTRAFMKGWRAAIDDPKAAYEAFIKANPTTDKVYAELKLPEVLKLTQSAEVKQNGLGASSKEGWDSLQAQLIDMDMMKERTDTSKIFTNDFLK